MELIIKSPKHGEFTCYYDDEDHELVSQYVWGLYKGVRGTLYARNNVYIPATQKGFNLFMHNLIMGRTGVDHIDNNGLNNRRENLRFATQLQNTRNQSIKSNNTTGYKGVSFDKAKRKYSAHITCNYKHIFGGYFNTIPEAAKRYNELAIMYHGEFAKLNKI